MIFLLGLFLCAFGYIAFYLYEKQNNPYSLLSFRVEQEQQAVLVKDMDRLLGKIAINDDALSPYLLETIKDGLSYLTNYSEVSFNEEVSDRLFLSWNESGFCLTLDNADLTPKTISTVLKEVYGVENRLEKGQLSFQEKVFSVEQIGNFLVISNTPFQTAEEATEVPLGNPDFMVFLPDSLAINHLLTRDYHFEVWKSDTTVYKSKPVAHQSLFEIIPSEFDEIVFYGGSRFGDDLTANFQSPDQELFSWVDQGILLIKVNDSMEVVIGRQNEQRDLRLILEEQTLSNQGDSAQLSVFNMGSFEVMHIETKTGWKESVRELDHELRYYTEYDNYNVLASSLSSMRWFLAEFQQDNFFLQNDDLTYLYTTAIPEKLNYLRIESQGDNCQVTARSNISSSGVVTAFVSTGASKEENAAALKLLADFPVEIIPTHIQEFNHSGENHYLLSNSKQLVSYTADGSKEWRIDLSSTLSGQPQFVDFENDGVLELVVYTRDYLDVVNRNGKSRSGFPVTLKNGSEGGLAINYDQSFNYRLLVSNGRSIDCYNESGKPVMGWLFQEMTGPLQGEIDYAQVNGKDYICFEDKEGVYYRLNRRGESRFEKNVRKNFTSETDFLVGTTESNLRKLGYKNQYIYSYYVKDGSRDSSKVDLTIDPRRIIWKKSKGQLRMIVEEQDRVITFDEFGYKLSEIIKQSPNQTILDVFGTQEFFYLFFDSYQNKLYLRNAYGHLLTGNPLKGSRTATLISDRLVTFVGNKIKVYVLN